MTDIAGIRKKEKQSHITLYENAVLFETGSWLQKPVQTVLDLLPHFQNNTSLRVLDLGCGVGRNCLAIAKQFQTIDCKIVCLDILDIAIEKLFFYAQQYGLSSMIHGIVGTIDDFSIPKDTYDWILAISALEHVHSKDCFLQKLMEIRDGIRHNGVVCLILNSDVQETDSITGEILPAQFEVNLPASEMLSILNTLFDGWEVKKQTVRLQSYNIPRDDRISRLNTHVVTFVAVK